MAIAIKLPIMQNPIYAIRPLLKFGQKKYLDIKVTQILDFHLLAKTRREKGEKNKNWDRYILFIGVLSSATAAQAFLVDFSGSSLSDDKIIRFCSEFDYNMPSSACASSYTYFGMVSYYGWAT